MKPAPPVTRMRRSQSPSQERGGADIVGGKRRRKGQAKPVRTDDGGMIARSNTVVDRSEISARRQYGKQMQGQVTDVQHITVDAE